ncbi:SGNH/GDSL hydrolase family protein [Celeribacter sp. SCSIO 80788]|uniref:SGNH/GDSL hydrolase family protein n=1 Tax=Celeribacter sp. SCSIO 80788 TaxID=3117013 RepID=UPI003DA291EB
MLHARMISLLTALILSLSALIASGETAFASGSEIAARSAGPSDTPQIERSGPRILALGDSMMAWHLVSKSSIADVLSQSLGEPVENRAMGGARILYGLPISGAIGMNITKQYRGDAVDWVVINGGGNDLWLGCGCKACERKMTRMISPEGTAGAIPELAREIRNSGARVIYLGYLRSPGVESVIDSCRELGDAFEARLTQMVRAMDGVYFLDVSKLVPEGDRSFHGADMIHPSKKGSRVIGQKLADVIRQVDDRR